MTLPHKGQCLTCKFKNDHPWPPCSHKVWSYLRDVEKNAIQSGVLSCMVRAEKDSTDEKDTDAMLYRRYLQSGIDDLISFKDYKANLKKREDIAGRCTE